MSGNIDVDVPIAFARQLATRQTDARYWIIKADSDDIVRIISGIITELGVRRLGVVCSYGLLRLTQKFLGQCMVLAPDCRQFGRVSFESGQLRRHRVGERDVVFMHHGREARAGLRTLVESSDAVVLMHRHATTLPPVDDSDGNAHCRLLFYAERVLGNVEPTIRIGRYKAYACMVQPTEVVVH